MLLVLIVRFLAFLSLREETQKKRRAETAINAMALEQKWFTFYLACHFLSTAICHIL